MNSISYGAWSEQLLSNFIPTVISFFETDHQEQNMNNANGKSLLTPTLDSATLWISMDSSFYYSDTFANEFDAF